MAARTGTDWKLVTVLVGTVAVIVAGFMLDSILGDAWKPTLAEKVGMMLLLGWWLVGRPLAKQLDRVEGKLDAILEKK